MTKSLPTAWRINLISIEVDKMLMPTDLDTVLKTYKTLLKSIYPQHHKQFCDRENDNKDAAIAEAIMFTSMQTLSYKVKILETNQGGVDFQCQSLNSLEEKFVIEVTSLNSDSVSKKSGLKNKIPTEKDGRSYDLINKLIWTKVSRKAKQMAEYPHPRVLAIFLNHFFVDLFFGRMPIGQLMTGKTKIQLPLDKPNRSAKNISYLEEALFFRFGKNTKKIEACRRSISAILLFFVDQNRSYLYGLLHPEPVIPFRIHYLPEVPFCRMAQWPPRNGILGVEWVVHRPSAFSVLHFEADPEQIGE